MVFCFCLFIQHASTKMNLFRGFFCYIHIKKDQTILIDDSLVFGCACGRINISKSWEFNYEHVQRFGVYKERKSIYWRLQSKQTNKQPKWLHGNRF